MCCCVCNLLCKLISLAVSILFIVAVVLLILWGVGVIFGSDDETTTTVAPLLNINYEHRQKLI